MAGGFVYNVIETPELSTSEIYGKTLADLAKEHKEIVAVTADLATSTKLQDFTNACPDRVFNVGIAEQNMLGVAAGMARAGLVPFASTFSVFASLRAADQLHTDICYQNVNAKIIATHSGTSFGQAGSTHHAIVDLAVTRSMPNLTVICPADGYETANAVRAAYENFGPYYIRINRGFDRVLYDNEDYGFEVGKAFFVVGIATHRHFHIIVAIVADEPDACLTGGIAVVLVARGDNLVIVFPKTVDLEKFP